jgi:hypothetical protein
VWSRSDGDSERHSTRQRFFGFEAVLDDVLISWDQQRRRLYCAIHQLGNILVGCLFLNRFICHNKMHTDSNGVECSEIEYCFGFVAIQQDSVADNCWIQKGGLLRVIPSTIWTLMISILNLFCSSKLICFIMRECIFSSVVDAFYFCVCVMYS